MRYCTGSLRGPAASSAPAALHFLHKPLIVPIVGSKAEPYAPMLLRSTNEQRYGTVIHGMMCQSTLRHNLCSSSFPSASGGGSASSPPWASSYLFLPVGCETVSSVVISTSSFFGDALWLSDVDMADGTSRTLGKSGRPQTPRWYICVRPAQLESYEAGKGSTILFKAWYSQVIRSRPTEERSRKLRP